MNYQDIEKIIKDYDAKYRANNERGKALIDFVIDNKQWDDQTVGRRFAKNKETLVYNATVKYLNKLKAQNRQLNYQVDVYQTADNNNEQEYQVFERLLKHWFTEKHIQEKFDEAFDKCADFGYAVAEVNFTRADSATLNYDPTIIIYDDPSEAFFDLQAQLKSRFDGNFCGRRRYFNREEMLNTYPQYEGLIQEKHNQIVDFWQREEKKVWYCLLQSGVWYRQDLLSESDYMIDPNTKQSRVKRGPDGKIIRKRGKRGAIYYYRFLNKEVIIDRRLFPTDDLPLVYHSGLTFWTAKGLRTYPYAFYLRDPQRGLNLLKSQLVNTVKNSTSSKYFFGPEHVTNDKLKDTLRDINSYEGSVLLQANPQDLLIDRPTEIPASLINLSQQIGNDLEMISGAASEAQMSDNAILSGKAVKEITHNIQLMNVGLLSEHIRFIETICELYVQMMPNICTEERVFFVKNNQGKMEKIGVNIKTPTGIQNDVRHIRNQFMYEVQAGPSTTMQQENTIKSLIDYYKIVPSFAQLTGDIFFKNLDIPCAMELARRASASIPPQFIAYGNGEMTDQQFQQFLQQQQQQQAQPSDQASLMTAHAVMMNAQTQQMKVQSDAELNQAKLAAQAQNDEQRNNIQAAQVMGNLGDNLNSHEIEKMRLQNDNIQHVIDVARLQEGRVSD